jgi:hypothetical protein
MFVAVPQIAINCSRSARQSRKTETDKTETDKTKPDDRATPGARSITTRKRTVMHATPLRISRRPLAIAASLVGMVSLAIGAHAALNKRALEPAKAAPTEQNADAAGTGSRIALVIGNGHYPDAAAPLAQPINDARGLTEALRRDGFDVDVVEDAGRDDMVRAVERLKSRVKPDSVVMLFFGGYGVQVGSESYMLPIDATIWKESDVRRQGISVESVLSAMTAQGARAKLAVIDASRRNPYERRFRAFSHGLAPIEAPDNALILSSATPGQVADDSDDQHSVLVAELLNHVTEQGAGAEGIFNETRVAIVKATDGAQVPSVSSSLQEELRFGVDRTAEAKAGS